MDDIFGTPTESTRQADKKPTISTQKAYVLPTGGKMEAYRIRFPKNHWNLLKKHFKAKGMRISEGLRMIAREYMEREDIK